MTKLNDTTAIIEFICDYIKHSSEHDLSELSASSNFVEQGWLDSFGILSLIMALETTYNIKFEPAELADTELRIIQNMANCVVNKLSL